MKLLDEKVFLSHISAIDGNSYDKENYGFSIINNGTWQIIVDCHIKLRGIDSLILAARWANESEKAMIASENAYGYINLSKIITKTLDTLKVDCNAKLIDDAYKILKSIWGYENVLAYPIVKIKYLIDRETKNADKPSLPYSLNF